jgi:hypothetical protein
MMGFISNTGYSVKINPTLFLIKGKNPSNSGITLCPPLTSLKNSKSSSSLSNSFNLNATALFKTVFFPMTKTPLLARIYLLICWH